MRTAHLELMPYPSEHLLGLMDGDERFEECFGLPAAEGLRGFFTSDEVSPAWLAQLRASRAADLWFHGLAIVHLKDGVVIGIMGFKGLPDDAGAREVWIRTNRAGR